MKRLRCLVSFTRILGFTASAFLLAGIVATANAAVLTDDFSESWPYDAVGDVPGYDSGATSGNTIWSGLHNVANLSGGLLNASIDAAGELIVEDNNVTNVGWEGGRSTAPMLFTPVAGNQDFTATVKISAQTSGFWSAAGLIARASNSPTPPGAGADNADENFVTMTTFRTDAAIPDEGNTLMKRIEAGAQVSDVNIAVVNPGTEPLPMLVRLEKVGGGTTYRGWVSTDGGATYQFQSRVRPTAGNALRDGATALDVGLSYMNFGGSAGTAKFDDFVLDTHDPLPAPGAPAISAAQTSFVVNPGDTISTLITNSTPGQGPLEWIRVADPMNPPAPTNPPTVSSLSAMLPGAQGGPPSALVPVPASFDESYFRWNTAVSMAGAPNVLPPVNWSPGTYKWSLTATNDWGQASAPIEISVTVVPEPTSLALIGLAALSLSGCLVRRRKA